LNVSTPTLDLNPDFLLQDCNVDKDEPAWCECHKGFQGRSCDGLDQTLCPRKCNDRGKCIRGFCHCEAPWFGLDCSRSKVRQRESGGEERERGGERAAATLLASAPTPKQRTCEAGPFPLLLSLTSSLASSSHSGLPRPAREHPHSQEAGHLHVRAAAQRDLAGGIRRQPAGKPARTPAHNC
jgi:hypothetical protein